LSLVVGIGVVSDVKPGPAIKTADAHAADVVWWQILADFVSLVCAHPELIAARSKCDPDGVPNSPRINFLVAGIGVELEDASAICFRVLSESFERDPIETYIFLPSGEKTMSRVQCPPLRRRAAPPESCAPNFSAGARALRSPLRYGKRIMPSVFATYKNSGSFPGG